MKEKPEKSPIFCKNYSLNLKFPELIESPFSHISTFPLYIHSYTDSPSLYVIPEVAIEQYLTG